MLKHQIYLADSISQDYLTPHYYTTYLCILLWFWIILLIAHFYLYLKSATKPLKVLIAFTRPLITEFADNLNLKHPLLPTISPYPTM